jgi:hypothetical protein
VQAVYSGSSVCKQVGISIYLSKGITKRSEVADTRGSTATA